MFCLLVEIVPVLLVIVGYDFYIAVSFSKTTIGSVPSKGRQGGRLRDAVRYMRQGSRPRLMECQTVMLEGDTMRLGRG